MSAINNTINNTTNSNSSVITLKRAFPQLTVIDYSERGFVVQDNSFAEIYQRLGGFYNTNLRCGEGWVFSKNRHLAPLMTELLNEVYSVVEVPEDIQQNENETEEDYTDDDYVEEEEEDDYVDEDYVDEDYVDEDEVMEEERLTINKERESCSPAFNECAHSVVVRNIMDYVLDKSPVLDVFINKKKLARNLTNCATPKKMVKFVIGTGLLAINQYVLADLDSIIET